MLSVFLFVLDLLLICLCTRLPHLLLLALGFLYISFVFAQVFQGWGGVKASIRTKPGVNLAEEDSVEV